MGRLAVNMAVDILMDVAVIPNGDGTLPTVQALTYFMPLTGVVATQFDLTGELRTVSAGETGDYATDFGVGNQHAFILINTIGAGGNIVITGTSLSEGTAVPVPADTETITVDATAAQYYQTDKKWLEITNVDVSALTTPDYDVGVIGYMDLGNRDFTILGYRAEFKVTSNSGDIRLRMRKIQDDGSGKMSLVATEDVGFDSTAGNGDYFDHVRSGGDDRSYTMVGSALAAIGDMVVFKMGDFATFYVSDENVFESNSKAEGLLIDFFGEPSGGISNIDHCTLTIYYQLD